MWQQGLDPETEKGHQWKNWGDQSIGCSGVNSIVPVLT